MNLKPPPSPKMQRDGTLRPIGIFFEEAPK